MSTPLRMKREQRVKEKTRGGEVDAGGGEVDAQGDRKGQVEGAGSVG